jgi:hypothetical protein
LSLGQIITVGVDTWTNYSGNGFDDAVYAITGDTSFLYFGGKFNAIFTSSLTCKCIACYDINNGRIYSLDNLSIPGGGFDLPVWGLSIIGIWLCVAGEFTNMIIGSGIVSVKYCIGIRLAGNGYSVLSFAFLLGGASTLSTPITIPDSVKTNGVYFYISTADVISSSGINYMIRVDSTFTSASTVGANEFTAQQTSFVLNGLIGSVGISDLNYFRGGLLITTAPFTPYIYWNNTYARFEFIDTTSGTIYFFSNSNNFSLSGGRIIQSVGVPYTGGWSITPPPPSSNGFGFNSVLLWNGTYYSALSVIGVGTPY